MSGLSKAVGNTTDELYNQSMGYPVIEEVIAFDGSVASTAVLSANTTYMVTVDEYCHVAFAASPTAATTDSKLIPDYVYIWHIPYGNLNKVAAIKASGGTAGNLYLSTLSTDRLGP